MTFNEKEMVLNIFSIISLVFYFNFARPLIAIFVGDKDGQDLNTRLVDHIVQFSLNRVDAGNGEVGK